MNNPGHGDYAPMAQITEAQFDGLGDVHFKGVFPHAGLAAADRGRRSPGYAAYAAVKCAVEVLTVYMAKELGARGIAVSTVAPGAIETDFRGGAVRDNPEVSKLFADMPALGRVGLPDDIGPMIASLLSDDNRWINARRIEVSGGQGI